MKRKKSTILITSIVFILASAFIILFNWNDIALRKSMRNFNKIIEKENLDDLSLTIYYFDTLIFINPLSVEELTNWEDDVRKVVYNGRDLAEHIDVLKQINPANFKSINIVPVKLNPKKWRFAVDAREYYVFETSKNGKVLEIIRSGLYYNKLFSNQLDSGIVINGILVEYTSVFYAIEKSFLPDDAFSFGNMR